MKVQTKTRKRNRDVSASGEAFTPEKSRVLGRLKEWRLRVSKELDQPAFVIFSDKALRDLVTRNPQSLDDLKAVYGFGPAKIERFGRDVLQELGES